MTAVVSQSVTSIQYPGSTVKRAELAMRCAPFQLHLFNTMCWQSVALTAIADQAGFQHHYTRRVLPELVAESQLLWLIQVGVLRREVDGQGLTDSFRLTPLGRLIVERWQQMAPRSASFSDRLRNNYHRWLRLPF